MSVNDNVFSGYFVVSDDMVILPERIKDFDKTSIWMPNMITANLTAGKCLKKHYLFMFGESALLVI